MRQSGTNICMPYRYFFQVWLFVYVSLYVCKRTHDTGEIPSVGQLKKKTANQTY